MISKIIKNQQKKSRPLRNGLVLKKTSVLTITQCLNFIMRFFKLVFLIGNH